MLFHYILFHFVFQDDCRAELSALRYILGETLLLRGRRPHLIQHLLKMIGEAAEEYYSKNTNTYHFSEHEIGPLPMKTHPYSISHVPTTQLAKMSIYLKFVELTADVLEIFLIKYV